MFILVSPFYITAFFSCIIYGGYFIPAIYRWLEVSQVGRTMSALLRGVPKQPSPYAGNAWQRAGLHWFSSSPLTLLYGSFVEDYPSADRDIVAPCLGMH